MRVQQFSQDSATTQEPRQFDEKLLEHLVCPLSKKDLRYSSLYGGVVNDLHGLSYLTVKWYIDHYLCNNIYIHWLIELYRTLSLTVPHCTDFLHSVRTKTLETDKVTWCALPCCRYDKVNNELVCDELGVAYPIVNGIPNLVPQDARMLKDSPKDSNSWRVIVIVKSKLFLECDVCVSVCQNGPFFLRERQGFTM